MGVIKDSNPKKLFASTSEESLHIPLESDEEEVQLPQSAGAANQNGHSHIRRRKPCVPMSFNQAGRKRIGKRRGRRYENVAQLVTLIEEEEFSEEVSINEFIAPTKTPFQMLLEDEDCLKVWNSFVNSAEEVQQLIWDHRFKSSKRHIFLSHDHSAEKAFNNISRPLQNILQHKAPMEMVAHMENEILCFFTASPHKTYISVLLNGFERLVLHGIAHYYHLNSTSLAGTTCNERKVRIRNPLRSFVSPVTRLADYLEGSQKKQL